MRAATFLPIRDAFHSENRKTISRDTAGRIALISQLFKPNYRLIAP
jgi:hypothetical protein